MNIRDLLPPLASEFLRVLHPGTNTYVGPFSDWNAARRHAGQYDDPVLIDNVARAARASRDDPALIDQDAVLLRDMPPPFPLVAILLDAWRRRGHLHVLDFGGALGTSFRRCRPFLPAGAIWTIVEQPVLARIGAAEFADETLRFEETIEAATTQLQPDVILLSSVLQYIDDPDALLDRLASLSSAYLLLERTPVTKAPDHRAAVQVVPRRIYPASYPLWLLSRQRILSRLSGWTLVSDTSSPEGRTWTRRLFRFEFRDILLGLAGGDRGDTAPLAIPIGNGIT
ncbi:methyltransferase, TIGR04325 family [Sphingomonas psychrotolerans]|uniref:Methyltransferase, TIGR04325 family n=1 Tax=Sphingomonas psychrotolerans TaxID=1327635 RepID=A0A2K8MK91_9SPHN|nr:methyltransferase, TIGR04325 family [Sphingomonas psychrotolerans]ATY34290.1 hypothetical protein CVN68_21930 [Sphingomonas psychrotolerans]